LMAGYY